MYNILIVVEDIVLFCYSLLMVFIFNDYLVDFFKLNEFKM